EIVRGSAPAKGDDASPAPMKNAAPASSAKPGEPETTAPKALDASAIVRQAYLRTLSRLPSEPELARCRQGVEQSSEKASGVRNVLWALLNTKEFIVNH